MLELGCHAIMPGTKISKHITRLQFYDSITDPTMLRSDNEGYQLWCLTFIYQNMFSLMLNVADILPKYLNQNAPTFHQWKKNS